MNLNILKGEIYAVFGSQARFARKIKWSENKVSALINKKYTPDVNEAAIIAGALRLSDEKFINIFLRKSSPNGEIQTTAQDESKAM